MPGSTEMSDYAASYCEPCAKGNHIPLQLSDRIVCTCCAIASFELQKKGESK